LYGQEEVIEQVEGSLGGRGGIALDHRESRFYCHEGFGEGLAIPSITKDQLREFVGDGLI
jgi:hypothetical protein